MLGSVGLTFTRASDATVQTSQNTVVTNGIGVNAPRVGNAGYGKGLVIEEPRTNLVVFSRDTTGLFWSAGTGEFTASYATSPDGTNNASRHKLDITEFGRYVVSTSSLVGAAYTFSEWVRTADASPGYVQMGVGFGDVQFSVSALNSGSWQRISKKAAISDGSWSYMTAQDGRALTDGTARAVDAVCDLFQIEAGKFATEAIVTTGSYGTRSGDRLRIDSTSRFVRDGRMYVELQFIPKANQSDLGSGERAMLYINSTNYISIDSSSGTIVVMVAGSFVGSNTNVTFNAGDIVRIYLEVGNGRSTIWTKVNDSAAVDRSDSTIMGSWPASSAMDIFNSNAGSQVNVWLQSIRCFNPPNVPDWIS
jgi:hypothetical protein